LDCADEDVISSRIRNRWWIVAGSAAALIFSTGPVLQFTFGVFVKPVSESLGADRGRVSEALLVAFVLSGLLTPVAGHLVDRFGVRRFGIPVVALFGLSFALIGLTASSIGAFIVGYALVGIFSAGQSPLIYAKAIAAAFDSRRGLALGLAMAGVGVGTALVPRLAEHLIAVLGWRMAYEALGLLTMVVATASVALWVVEPAPAVGGHHMVASGVSAAEALKSLLFWKLLVSFLVVVIAVSGIMAHIVPLMTDRGIPPALAALALTAGGLALVAGRLIAGYVLDRLFAPYVAVCFFSMPMIAIGILLNFSTAVACILGAALVGAGLGAEVDLIAYLQSRYFGLKSFGVIYSYFLATFFIGSGLGPYFMGFVFAQTGAYTIALRWLLAAVGLAWVMMFTFPAYRYGVGRPVWLAPKRPSVQSVD
jgi:MFS family permease